ncbi:MAG: hypothetical protein M3Y27_12605 [Acidobacteriota bacterium]|nr:hypothetical protein [Acidobacteriota bacterium]
MSIDTMDGPQVETNQRRFIEAGGPRNVARWKGAVAELHELGLTEDRVGKGEVYFAAVHATAKPIYPRNEILWQ